MTIKNAKKNISDEEGLVITDISKADATIENKNITTPTETFDSADQNYKTNCSLIFSFQDWENEDDWKTRQNNSFYEEDPTFKWDSQKSVYKKVIDFPLTELVRLGHLTKYYYNKTDVYTKDEVDAKVKLHFYIWNNTTPPTVAQVKALVTNNTIPSYDNYIFLVPYNPNYDGDNDNETYQEGVYREFVYVNRNGTESIEEVGSLQLDLKPYLKTVNLDNELYTLSGNNLNYQATTGANAKAHYKKVIEEVDKISSKADKQQSLQNAFVVTKNDKEITTKQRIDKIDIDGYIYTGSDTNTKATGKILTTDSNGKINPVTEIKTDQILNKTALTKDNQNPAGGINANTSKTQDYINGEINSALKSLNINVNGCLKNTDEDIKEAIWGTAPNRLVSKQQGENPNNAEYSYKLGDYIHYILYDSGEFYSADDIDGLYIGAINIQNNTLGML